MRLERRKHLISHDRWMVSYADFITLLFAFFVVLFAFAKADQKKQSQVTQAIDPAFRSLGIFPGIAAIPAAPPPPRRRTSRASDEHRHGRRRARPAQGQRRPRRAFAANWNRAFEPGRPRTPSPCKWVATGW